MKAEAAMRSAVWELKEAGYDYAERIELFRLANMQTEVRANKGVKKHAAKKLGISRAALCAYLKRGKELL
jgi:DNA-binding NtrC family response regulator